MLTITRRTFHRFRTVARRVLGMQRGLGPPIALEPAGDGLWLQVGSATAVVQLRLTADGPGQRVCVPWELLDDCQANSDQVVTLTCEDGRLLAQWQDGSVRQVLQYDLVEPPADALRPTPAEMIENPPGLLQALADACGVTDPEPTRYALSCVQLDGDRGRVAASDGRQILTQTGFVFPWPGAVLLPASKLFACPQLPRGQPLAIGRSEHWLTMRLGPWTFHWRLNLDGRFPRVDACLPRDDSATTSLEIADGDATFLAENIKQLPSSDDPNQPVTLDLGGEVVVRVGADDKQPVTELVLVNSTRTGSVLRINTNRQLLARALALGFRQLQFLAPDQPAFCRQGQRAYLWAPLGVDGAIATSQNAHRIHSPNRPASRGGTKARPSTRRNIPPMSESTSKSKPDTKSKANSSANSGADGNGHKQPAAAAAHQTDRVDNPSPVQQAEALRDSLKDALDKTRDLIRSLKRQQKTSRVVESTLASLRQLQTADL